MSNTVHTHIRGRRGRLLGVLLAAFALSLPLGSCGGSEAKTVGTTGRNPMTTTAVGQAVTGNTTIEGTDELVMVNGLPLLTVEVIEPGIDGYTTYLTDSIGVDYTAVISIPNLEDAFVALAVGDVVTISGEYAESLPVQIFSITDIAVESAMG
jgi:hypothetical protein